MTFLDPLSPREKKRVGFLVSPEEKGKVPNIEFDLAVSCLCNFSPGRLIGPLAFIADLLFPQSILLFLSLYGVLGEGIARVCAIINRPGEAKAVL